MEERVFGNKEIKDNGWVDRVDIEGLRVKGSRAYNRKED